MLRGRRRTLICNTDGSWLNFTTGELVEDAIEARAEASMLQCHSGAACAEDLARFGRGHADRQCARPERRDSS